MINNIYIFIFIGLAAFISLIKISKLKIWSSASDVIFYCYYIFLFFPFAAEYYDIFMNEESLYGTIIFSSELTEDALVQMFSLILFLLMGTLCHPRRN